MSGAGFWRAGTGPKTVTNTNWLALCQATKGGGPIANLHNVLLALRNDPQWVGRLRYDEMLRSIVLPSEPIGDVEVYQIHEWMQGNGLKRIGLDAVREAVEIVGRETTFHPLKDWFAAASWDGQLRLTNWLITYLGAEDNEYHRQIGYRFLIAMVARIFEPGCQADYMVVLIGEQGELKSRVCRILASTPYFSSHLPDLGGDPVRVSMHLKGKWLIEVAELAAFLSSRVGQEHLKAFISNPVEQYTPKFGRSEVREPRQCLFIGTHNDPQFLKDETGNRRFWPVICGNIKLDRLEQDRDQLLAEACELYQAGKPWWPDRQTERDYLEPVQKNHLAIDAWIEPIETFLATRAQTTTLEIATDALLLAKAEFDPAKQKRVIATLKHLGWIPGRTMSGRFWSKP